jgi:hypothetical protein
MPSSFQVLSRCHYDILDITPQVAHELHPHAGQMEHLQQMDRAASALERCARDVGAQLAAGALQRAEELAHQGGEAAKRCSDWYAALHAAAHTAVALP